MDVMVGLDAYSIRIVLICLTSYGSLSWHDLLVLRSVSSGLRNAVEGSLSLWDQMYRGRFAGHENGTGDRLTFQMFLKTAKEQRFPRKAMGSRERSPDGYMGSWQMSERGWSRYPQLGHFFRERQTCGPLCLACGSARTWKVHSDRATESNSTYMDWSQGSEWRCDDCMQYSHCVVWGVKQYAGLIV